MPPCWRLIAEGSGGSVCERGRRARRDRPRRRPTARSSTRSSTRTPSELLAFAGRRSAPPTSDAGVEGLDRLGARGRRRTAAGLERGRPRRSTARPATWACRWPSCASPTGEAELRVRRARGLRASWRASTRSPTAIRRATTSRSPRRRCPGIRIYFAALDGEEVCTLGIWPHGADAVVIWVATLPEARGRGIARPAPGPRPAQRSRGRATRPRRCSRPSSAARSTSGSATATSATPQMWERRQQDRVERSAGYVAPVPEPRYSDRADRRGDRRDLPARGLQGGRARRRPGGARACSWCWPRRLTPAAGSARRTRPAC